MENTFQKVHIRMYHEKEIPVLIGVEKRTIASEIERHKAKLGSKIGYYWKFEQVLMILKIFGIRYVIVE
jgi:hypothetical protein